MYRIVLVPGFWLGGWAWDAVAAQLRSRGHDVAAVTLPGLDRDVAESAGIGLADQVAALRAIIDNLDQPPVVVAHSGAGRILSGVLDAAPHSVAGVIYVDSGPAADGTAHDGDLPPDLTRLSLPPWDQLTASGASLDGLDHGQLQTFRARSVAQPARVAREPIHLTNDARREVRTTIIACSITSGTVLELARAGHPMFAEVARLTNLEIVDLPTGHWPMWSRPADLAAAISSAARACP